MHLMDTHLSNFTIRHGLVWGQTLSYTGDSRYTRGLRSCNSPRTCISKTRKNGEHNNRHSVWVLTAASMMFRIVFWDILPCKMIGSLMMEAVRTSDTSVDNHFTRQYISEDNSENRHSDHKLALQFFNVKTVICITFHDKYGDNWNLAAGGWSSWQCSKTEHTRMFKRWRQWPAFQRTALQQVARPARTWHNCLVNRHYSHVGQAVAFVRFCYKKNWEHNSDGLTQFPTSNIRQCTQ
jgi:hypothetical protein